MRRVQISPSRTPSSPRRVSGERRENLWYTKNFPFPYGGELHDEEGASFLEFANRVVSSSILRFSICRRFRSSSSRADSLYFHLVTLFFSLRPLFAFSSSLPLLPGASSFFFLLASLPLYRSVEVLPCSPKPKKCLPNSESLNTNVFVWKVSPLSSILSSLLRLFLLPHPPTHTFILFFFFFSTALWDAHLYSQGIKAPKREEPKQNSMFWWEKAILLFAATFVLDRWVLGTELLGKSKKKEKKNTGRKERELELVGGGGREREEARERRERELTKEPGFGGRRNWS